MVVDDIKEAVLRCAGIGRSHHKVLGEHVLEELDSADIKVVVAPHLGELGTRVNTHLLVPLPW
jgi:hypothetical protein